MAPNSTGGDAGEPFLLREFERPLIGALLGIVSVCAFFGNVLVIVSFALSKKLQNTTNVFVVNLSAADLVTGVSVAVNVVALTRPQSLPAGLCVWCGFASVTCVGCSVYTLACIAAYRFNVISKRQRQFGRSAKAAAVSAVVGLTWILPVALSVAPLLFGLGDFGFNSKYSSCTWNSSTGGLYSLILSVCYYPIPMLVIIASYSGIFVTLKKIKKRVTPEQIAASDASSAARTGRNAPRAPLAQDRRQATVTKNMFYVVCAFLVCTTPYSVALVCPGSEPFIPYSAVVLVLSSGLNPTIYATKHPDFGRVMRKVATCDFQNIPHYVFK